MGRVKNILSMRSIRLATGLATAGLGALIIVPAVSANRFNSTSYTIDASVANGFGGATSSSSYKMESSGGEAVVGNGTAGSYKLGQGYIAQLERSLELRVQPESVAAHYHFDENYGTKGYDSSINNTHASLSNSPTWVSGKIGQAVTFNGSSQSGVISSSSQNNIETLTISAWVKTTQSLAVDTPIIQKWNGTGGFPYALRLDALGTVSMSASDGTLNPSVSSTTVINNGAWQHIAGVRTKGSQLKIYVNGVLEGTTTDTTSVTTTNSSDVGIARRSGGANYFGGTVDEVKIFNKALTNKEVANEYASQNAGISSAMTFAVLDAASSKTLTSNVIVHTDAPGYTVALSQDGNMTSGGNSIPAISSGTIATPAAWNEGTTKGLGFTLTAGNNLPSKWGTSPNYNYAAIPGTSTSFYTRSGYTGGVKDILSIEHRVDIPPDQVAGDYKNTVTYSATIVP